MAREIRFIVLEEDDILFQMRDLAVERGNFVLNDRQEVVVSTDRAGRPVATLVEREAEGEERALMRLEGRDLVGLAIRFCRQRQIPLPKSGIKRLDLFEGNVAMVIDLRLASRQSRSLAETAAARPAPRLR